MDNQTIVCLLARTKKTDLFETQATNHAYSEYEKKRYTRANRASV